MNGQIYAPRSTHEKPVNRFHGLYKHAKPGPLLSRLSVTPSLGSPWLLQFQCPKGDGSPLAPPGRPKPAYRWSIPLWTLPEMCAAVAKVKDPAANGADKNDGMLTASFEAAQIFIDDGRQREFAPGAAARAMPGLREQRKTRQYCDVVFRANDDAEVWAHRFVMSAKNEVGCPPFRPVIKDLEGDVIELLVDFAYQLTQIRDHCLKTLKKDLEPENSIETYHLASSHGYEYLAGEAFRYLKHNAQFEALTAEEMQTILEDDRLNAPSEVEETFQAILNWNSADAAARKKYLVKFLPLVRFVRCSVYVSSTLDVSGTEFEKVVSHPEVQGDERSLKVLHVIYQTLTRHSIEVGEIAGIDLSSKQWLTPRVPKDILFVFGGWTSGATNSMHTFNSRAQKWRVMGSQYTPPRGRHHVTISAMTYGPTCGAPLRVRSANWCSNELCDVVSAAIIIIISSSSSPLPDKALSHDPPVNSVLCLLLPLNTRKRANLIHPPNFYMSPLRAFVFSENQDRFLWEST
ncbi:hypothetical protein HPB51_022697 [Rhipicephalus microplus]|uniref:BACK domain-containing protein n=1 Tax=Rhipicephalus microplus TaxID=6941 RepID=A0A9J6E513_RHIMP|nr:hypothetical protein HPB51_022697 [Rhipicephalus microplus]